MTPCPECGMKPISSWVKLTLGPARTLACRECGTRITVESTRAMLVVIPAIFAFAMLRLPTSLAIIGFIGGIAISALLQIHWVRFIRKN